MIAVDTSALMAVLLDEPVARACAEALEVEDRVIISAGTMVEALIVASGRDLGAHVQRLIAALGFEVVSVTGETAIRIEQIYRRWGKGNHPASLNLGDCFAYDVAKEHGCPLLYIGDDFTKTDIKAAL